MSDGLYLGKIYDPRDRSLGDRFLLDPADLTTHGIVIGMTGSGKTGLSVVLIEEALKARIPVIVIDPKGDMTNLALAFDRLAPEQFEPWVDRDEAARAGKAPAEFAAEAAERWKAGLADWGISTEDVAAHSSNHRLRVFTPGTTAGIPINVLDSLKAPGGDFEADEEDLRDEIDSIVTALLGFVRIQSDPMSGREYILLFSLIERAWRAGQDLDLETLVGQVANPPIERVGALPLEAFYPQKDRTALMLALNNLLASPPFEAWRQGEQIDIEQWVRGGDGRPQVSLVYTAHLDDDRRMFVTALILNKLKTWMRRQAGTGELRCLFYMDEIFGYFPPTANPPTKKPLLALLKQARAYGVGVLLATQNPVDLDYKGLSNMGFWAIGRLQTRQDQERIREGVEAALEGAGIGDFDTLMAGVQKRVFLVHDIHRKAPALVHSRWAMSYLRGPLTRDEIRTLGPAVEAADVSASPAPMPTAQGQAAPAPAAAPAAAVAPILPSPLRARFLNSRGGEYASAVLYVKAAVRYRAGRSASNETVHDLGFRILPDASPRELLEQEPVSIDGEALTSEAPAGLRFAELPAWLQTDGAKAIERALRERLAGRFQEELFYDPVSKLTSTPGESGEQFAIRVVQSDAVRAKRRALEERVAKKRSALDLQKQEVSGRRLEKWASLGTSVLSNIGIFSGRKRTVSGVGGVLSKNRMENTAERRREALQREVAALEQELADFEVNPSRFERRIVKPAKTDVSVIRYDIVWEY